MAGLLQRFTAGAAAQGSQLFSDIAKADIIAKRDERLAASREKATLQGQEFKTSEREATQEFDITSGTGKGGVKFIGTPSRITEGGKNFLVGMVRDPKAETGFRIERQEVPGEFVDVQGLTGQSEAALEIETLREKLKVELEQKPLIEKANKMAGAEGLGEANARIRRIDYGADQAKGIATLKRGIELLQTVETGGPEAISLAIKQKLGIEKADEGELANILATAVIAQYRTVFGAQFTENEGAKLDRVSQSFGKSPASNLRIMNSLLQDAESAVAQALNDAQETGDQGSIDAINRSIAFKFDPDRDIFAPAAPQITPPTGTVTPPTPVAPPTAQPAPVAAPPVTPALKPMSPEVLNDARQAISQGKDRAAIIKRLQELGFDSSGL